MKRKFVGVLTLLGAASLAAVAMAQGYPVKPIRMVVPNPAGGIDAYARVFLPKAIELLGQPIVIDNRAGASGAIGAENVARSAPDGYSLLFSTSAQIVLSPFLNRNLPYDALRDFTPISKLLEPVEVLVVNPALPVRTVKELIDYAKRNPGTLSYGSSGVGSAPHFDGELLKSAAGIDLLHVPFKGVAQIVPELVAGRIDLGFPSIGAVAPMLAAGKLRVLALLDETRYERLPLVPSITDDLPGFRQAPIWFAVFGPAGLPRPVVDRVQGAFATALNAPEVRSHYDEIGMRVIAGSPEELAAAIRRDMEITARLVKAIGLKAD